MRFTDNPNVFVMIWLAGYVSKKTQAGRLRFEKTQGGWLRCEMNPVKILSFRQIPPPDRVFYWGVTSYS